MFELCNCVTNALSLTWLWESRRCDLISSNGWPAISLLSLGASASPSDAGLIRQAGATNTPLATLRDAKHISFTRKWYRSPKMSFLYPCYICGLLNRALLWRPAGVKTSYEHFGARSRYLGLGQVITSHRILWDVITYPCPRYLFLALRNVSGNTV